jgi:antitoxin (DNA-binding transcriptional repressor) of toxin-antitoxin stability system
MGGDEEWYNKGMSTISVDDINRDPQRFLERVENGESLLVVRGDCPVAEVTPVARPETGLRPYGLAYGQFTVPDDFDSPLPDDPRGDRGL